MAASGTTEETQALLYLQKYGYVENRDGTGALLSEEGIKKQLAKAVRDFQAFAGLNQTGELDPITVELMGTPRCGVNDIIGHGATARRKKICSAGKPMEGKPPDLQNHTVSQHSKTLQE